MSLISMVFGKWEVVREGIGTVGFINFRGKEWEEQVGITVERHTRTQKERAFIHRLSGMKQPTSLEVVKTLNIPEVSK